MSRPILASVFILLSVPLFAAESAILGRWKTFDDETGEAKSIVLLYLEGGELKGKVDSLLPQPGKDPNRVCEKCEGDRKGKPIRGMVIAWGLKRKGDGWEGGKILDPVNGKTYGCKLRPMPDGKFLVVRGFIGVSLLGRSQKWERVE